MRIGELASRTGVSIRALRYYEEQQLLHPQRLSSRYRIYDEADVVRVQQIQALLEAGLGTSKIEHILPCLAQHGQDVALTCGDLFDELVNERAALMARIATLETSVKALDRVIKASPHE